MVCAVSQVYSGGVDTAAAYMTVFGRTATPAEITYWQNRLPATQAELVEINLNWLVSPSGAKDLKETIGRGFQQVFSRQPDANEQLVWENKIKQSRMVFQDFVASLKGAPSNSNFVVNQVMMASPVDANAAYMTVFGRTATTAEIDYWKTRLPATQADLVKINADWLVSPSGAKDLNETIGRGFQQIFYRQPTSDELAKWGDKVKKARMIYADLIKALKAVNQQPTLPPAFPATTTTPVVYSCPIAYLAPSSDHSDRVQLSRTGARFGQWTITCDYTLPGEINLAIPGTCPDKATADVVSALPNTTTRDGCNINSAWCAPSLWSGNLKSPSSNSCTYSGGSVSLEHHVEKTCWGGPGAAGNNSVDGEFICW